MDPEDLREVIAAYQKCVAETVQRSGGFVAKYMGDGVLVYFGHPQAHEDDAERAVRAGLELIEAVGALKSSAPLQTRVGIATGLVVVGDLIGTGASQEQAVIGETPNLAARLQALAEPNNVVIAESTRKLLGNLFEVQDLGGQGPQGHRRSSASLGSVATGFRMTTMETTEERLYEAEIYRMAGEIAVKSPERDQAKAQDYFDHALTVARQQQAKSWELRAAMSMARLWRDQGKRTDARDLLAPVYGWFSEGFDTRDLKEAKALLEGLA
jgi:Adenylate and Guanylate cyclase catalytic domain